MDFQTKDGSVTREQLKKMIGKGPFKAGYWKTADAAARSVRARYRISSWAQWPALLSLCEELWREALQEQSR